MRLNNPFLMAAFGLLSTLSAQAANIKISSLPFAMTTPGTYVVTGNLSFSATTNVVAISISTAVQDPVILDLKGFTLTGAGGDSIGVGIGLFAGTGGSNSYPITVRNGSLMNFGFGVLGERQLQQGRSVPPRLRQLLAKSSAGRGFTAARSPGTPTTYCAGAALNQPHTPEATPGPARLYVIIGNGSPNRRAPTLLVRSATRLPTLGAFAYTDPALIPIEPGNPVP